MNVKLKTLLALAVAAPLFAGSAIAVEQQSNMSVALPQSSPLSTTGLGGGFGCPPQGAGPQPLGIPMPWCQ